MSDNPIQIHGVRTRSMSIQSSSQQQFTSGVVLNEHESNANNILTNIIPLSPIPRSPPSATYEQSNSKLSPADLSTRLEDTLKRETTTPTDKNSSIDASNFLLSQLSLIGRDTEDRIRNSSSSLQQQILDLNDKQDRASLNNSKLLEQMSSQIANTSSILEHILNRLPPQTQTNKTNHTDPLPSSSSNSSQSSSMSSLQQQISTQNELISIQSKKFAHLLDLQSEKFSDRLEKLRTQITHSPDNASYDPLASPANLINRSILITPVSSSSHTSSSSVLTSSPLELPYSIKDFNFLLDSSTPIKTFTNVLKNISYSLNNTSPLTPATVIHNQEAFFTMNDVRPSQFTILFMGNMRKNSLDMFSTFLEETTLPRADGKCRLDNPTTGEVRNWPWSDFRLSFISIFEDPTMVLKINFFLNTWSSDSFKSVKEATKLHLSLMKDLFYSKENLERSTPLTLQAICNAHLAPLRASFSQDMAEKLALFVTMLNSRRSLDNLLPMNIMEMNYETLMRITTEFTLKRDKDEAFFKLHKTSTRPNNTKVNLIETTPTSSQEVKINAIARSSSSSSAQCSHCGQTGHLEISCFKKFPHLLKTFICQLCKKTGHSITNCPEREVQ